jgi:hypothetical protein
MTFANALKYTLSVDGVQMYHPDSSLIQVGQATSTDEEDTYEVTFKIVNDNHKTTEHKYTFYVNGSEFKVQRIRNPITLNLWFMNSLLSNKWECTAPIKDVVP